MLIKMMQISTLETLQHGLNLLKEEYIKLLNDKDVLLHWGKPQLEALYSIRIGTLQVENLELQLRIKALKRKIQMVQSALSRQEQVDLIAIEFEVATELARVEEQLMKEVEKIAYSKILLTSLSSPEKSAKLRKLFRTLAKHLHPDVNPRLTEQQIEVWHLVLKAYENGHVEKLQALSVIYQKEIQPNDQPVFTEDEIELQIEILREGIKLLQEEILHIRQQFPFTIEVQIKDELWVKKQKDIILFEIQKLLELEKELNEKFALLIEL